MVVINKKHKETAQEKEARQRKEQEQALGIQDEYQAKGFELVSWVQNQKTMVSILIIALIGVGAAFSGYLYFKGRRSEMASEQFIKAMRPIEDVGQDGEGAKDKFKNAKAELSGLASTYSNTGVAVLADIYSGHLALKLDDADKSIERYQDALTKLAPDDPFYGLVLSGLGDAQSMKGDYDSAEKNYLKLLDLPPDVMKDSALYRLAQLSKAANKNDMALKYVERLLKEFPGSAFEREAKSLKDRL